MRYLGLKINILEVGEFTKMDINEKIEYRWLYGWSMEGIGRKPSVNRLMKAIIEKNIEEVDKLFRQGATILGMDETTFQRLLFHIVEDYDMMDCLIQHGFLGIYDEYSSFQSCLDSEGYSSGLLGRAWLLRRMDIFELLARSGFKELLVCCNGESYNCVKLIITNDDVEAIKILMENGFSRREFLTYRNINDYPNSKVICYLQNNPVIHRKTVMLDDCIFSDISKPDLEKPGFFNRKKVERKNQLLLADYKDRLTAQDKFKKQIGVDNWKMIRDEKKRSNQLLDEIMCEIANTF